jgi:HSP20 family protein
MGGDPASSTDPFLSPWPVVRTATDTSPGTVWIPPVDFVEEEDRYLIIMDAPGMKKGDFQIDYEETILYVRGSREHEKDVRGEESVLHVMERRCGSFVRHFHLYGAILPEKIRADYKSGILTVSVPKDERGPSKAVHVKVN